MLPLVRLNGHMFNRSSVTVRLNGAVRINGIDSINWSDEVPQELVGGMTNGGPPLGKGEGPYTCAADMSLYEDEAEALLAAIALLNPAALGALSKINFQLSISFREDVRIGTVVLVNCSIKGRSTSVGNDGSATVKQLTLQPTLVTENGLSLVSLIPSL